MTLDQFRQLAETWGGDVARWPPATQAEARAIAAQPEGRAMLSEQAAFDDLLSAAPDVASARADRAGFNVLQRIAAMPRDPPWYRRLLRPASLVPAGSLACSALLGIWMAGQVPYHQSQDAITVVSMVFDSSTMSLWGLQ